MVQFYLLTFLVPSFCVFFSDLVHHLPLTCLHKTHPSRPNTSTRSTLTTCVYTISCTINISISRTGTSSSRISYSTNLGFRFGTVTDTLVTATNIIIVRVKIINIIVAWFG